MAMNLVRAARDSETNDDRKQYFNRILGSLIRWDKDKKYTYDNLTKGVRQYY